MPSRPFSASIPISPKRQTRRKPGAQSHGPKGRDSHGGRAAEGKDMCTCLYAFLPFVSFLCAVASRRAADRLSGCGPRTGRPRAAGKECGLRRRTDARALLVVSLAAGPASAQGPAVLLRAFSGDVGLGRDAQGIEQRWPRGRGWGERSCCLMSPDLSAGTPQARRSWNSRVAPCGGDPGGLDGQRVRLSCPAEAAVET